MERGALWEYQWSGKSNRQDASCRVVVVVSRISHSAPYSIWDLSWYSTEAHNLRFNSCCEGIQFFVALRLWASFLEKRKNSMRLRYGTCHLKDRDWGWVIDSESFGFFFFARAFKFKIVVIYWSIFWAFLVKSWCREDEDRNWKWGGPRKLKSNIGGEV